MLAKLQIFSPNNKQIISFIFFFISFFLSFFIYFLYSQENYSPQGVGEEGEEEEEEIFEKKGGEEGRGLGEGRTGGGEVGEEGAGEGEGMKEEVEE